jgi:hypothetical protein
MAQLSMFLFWILGCFVFNLIYVLYGIQRLRIRIEGSRDEEESLLDNSSQKQNALYRFISLLVLLFTGISCVLGILKVPFGEYNTLLVVIDFISLVFWVIIVITVFTTDSQHNYKVLARANLFSFLSQSFLTIYWINDMIIKGEKVINLME